MPISLGNKLGPYEVTGPIGVGGMGEVYRARDTKLDREVAIKVLPDELANDKERVARFEREAKLLASLNHPNIASIYGSESGALVLELVEGPTLAEKVAEGPIPVDETIAIARQIAEALEAGHEAGVIHRDLKPANVKLKEDGTVKVLDYGLAKALEVDTPGGTDSELSQSPTLTRLRQGSGGQARQGTQIGVILGTAAYMSPEQGKGKRVDKRTDIWAFGAVVYEMLTGERAFPGEDVSETLASVIKSEPEWSRLPSHTPRWLRKLLRRCLEKDRSKRLRDIGDALLDWNESSEDTSEPERRVSGRPYALAALAALVAGILVWALKPSAPGADATSVSRFSINLPRDQELVFGVLRAPTFAITPDGRTLAYVATESRGRRLYIRALDSMSSELIEDTEGVLSPFFSPDGEWVGYFADNRLWKVSLTNRLPIAICDVFGEPVGGSWLATDSIVFTSGMKTGLYRVPADGGEPAPLTTVDASANELGHRWPSVVDSDRILYTIRRDTGFDFAIAIMDMRTGESRVLVEGARYAIVAPGGYLIYGGQRGADNSGVYAAPFDAERGTLTGPAVRLALDAYASAGGGTNFLAVSGSGDLVYATEPLSQVVWADRNGAVEPLRELEKWVNSGHLRLSPEGKRLAVGSEILDLERGTTHDPTTEASIFPMWQPGSDELAVFMLVDGLAQLFSVQADGGQAPTRLLEGKFSQIPSSWSPRDGTLLYTELHPDTDNDLWVLHPNGTTAPYLVTGASEQQGRFSPDGRFVAYESNESGRDEIYVRDYPEGERKWTISSSGGLDVVWSPTGRELFYRSQGFLMRVAITLEPGFRASTPEAMFEAPTALGEATYDITPDGERFIMLRGDAAAFRELHVVVNWREELKRLVPTEN